METAGITTTATIPNAPEERLNELSTNDFLKLLITELTQQDPFEPMKNADLLNQISSIRELEMNTKLNDTLESLVLQGSLGSAAGMIGKMINGMTASKDTVEGTVTGVRVISGEVMLQLDTGRRVNITDVTYVTETAETDAADPADPATD